MSYDVDILLPTDRGRWGRVEVGNMTCNVGPMYRLVMPRSPPGGGRYAGTGDPDPRAGLTGLSGLTVEEAIPILLVGLDAMDEREDELRLLEPENGWGTYDGARAFLRCIVTVCQEHPGGILAVDW